jgi:hypothetical protein
MERGDRGERRCVLTKDGDEPEWSDLEVSSGSVPDADGRRHLGHSRGQRCSGVGERRRCCLVLAELAVEGRSCCPFIGRRGKGRGQGGGAGSVGSRPLMAAALSARRFRGGEGWETAEWVATH